MIARRALLRSFLAKNMNVNKYLFPLGKNRKWAYLALIGLIYSFLFPQYSWAYFSMPNVVVLDDSVLASSNLASALEIDINQYNFATLHGNTLIANNFIEVMETNTNGPVCSESQKRLVIITAYTSALEETDSSPFITASGTFVRDGIIAANFLKIGTQVKIPALYGDKIFVVEDRMAKKNSHKVDIWMSSKAQALQFGVKRAEIIVLAD